MEIVRAAVAFVVFLAVLAPARWVGLGPLYGKAVLVVAQAIVVPTQHFPLLAKLDNLTLNNLEHVVILTFALFLVSTNLDFASRLSRFGPALAVIFAYHVIVVILTIKVQATQELLTSMNILVLSPAEFRVVDWLRYFAYDLGLEIAPFVMLILTSAWNLTASREQRAGVENRACPPRKKKRQRAGGPSRSGRRHLAAAAIGLGSLVVFASAAVLYGRWRETEPRHVEAHAKIGHLLWNSHKDALAEAQYRIALAGRTTDPEVFYNLAGLETRSGNRDAALRLLGQGARMAHTPEWRARFQKATVVIQARSTSP